jgi:uncharacterized protein (TIGR02453 family)
MAAARSLLAVAQKFSGIPHEAFVFYDGLVANNTKAWWTEHKADYDRFVKEPLDAMLAELEDEFGKAALFRPYRDVRFSKDKTPYKEHQGGFVGAEDAMGWYVQISRDGLMVAGGWYSAQGKQLARWRDAVGSPNVTTLRAAIAKAEKAGLVVGGDVMKTRPRGVPEDHPDLDLLKHRTLTVEKRLGDPDWASTRQALTKVRGLWRSMTPLVEWLVDHVGPFDDGIPPEPQ